VVWIPVEIVTRLWFWLVGIQMAIELWVRDVQEVFSRNFKNHWIELI